jgi:mono/diheme cytochrome c family protein
MKYTAVLIIFFSAILFFGFSNSTAEPEGKTVFVNSKCGSCHSVEAAGLTSKSKKSTDLSEAGKKHDEEVIAKYVTKKEKLNDKLHPAQFKGTDEELKQLTEWLSSLKGTK